MQKNTPEKTSFDLLEILGMNLSIEDKYVYYQEILAIFLFEFLTELLTADNDNDEIRRLNSELSGVSSPDSIMETIQNLHPDFLPKFVIFVDRQKEIFVISYLDDVIEKLEKRRKIIKKRNATKASIIIGKKIEKYQHALRAAQAENWELVKEILNPQAQELPSPQP